MAGGAADCQFWVRTVAKYCKLVFREIIIFSHQVFILFLPLFSLFELREGEPISVAAASKYFANVLYGYRDSGLSIVSTKTRNISQTLFIRGVFYDFN